MRLTMRQKYNQPKPTSPNTSCFSQCFSTLEKKFFSFFQADNEVNNPLETQSLEPSRPRIRSRALSEFIPPLIHSERSLSTNSSTSSDESKEDFSFSTNQEILKLTPDYKEKLIDLLDDEDTEFQKPSEGGAGGPSLFIENEFFVKFQFNSFELLGNFLFQQLGERVPETKSCILSRKIILDICEKVMNLEGGRDFASSLDRQLNDLDELRVLIMPKVLANNIRGLKDVKYFAEDNANILFLAKELGRIALKDIILRVGDRMINQDNPGNVMLTYNESTTSYDISQRLLLIDNVFGFQFLRINSNRMTKEEIQECIFSGVIRILGNCKEIQSRHSNIPDIVDIEGIRPAIQEGIQVGLTELSENPIALFEVIKEMDGLMNAEMIQSLLGEINADINMLLLKMQ